MRSLFLRPLLPHAGFLAVVILTTLSASPLLSFAAKSGMDLGNSVEILPAKPSQDNENIYEVEEASRTISGTSWPGIIDHLLQKPEPGKMEMNNQSCIHINYPSTGNKRVDNDIRAWVASIASAFEEHFVQGNTDIDNKTDLEIESFLGGEDPNTANLETPKYGFELWGDYKIERPSARALSVTFELWNYTGQNSGNLDILTLNYSLLTGQRLTLVDIFENPDVALELMSSWSRKQLASRLGAASRTRMLEAGTEPLIENFSSLTLTPDGICINFQPYQVAPWSAGIQKVEMPLSELMDAAPFLALWEN